MFGPARLSRGLSLSWNFTWLISPSHCTRRRSPSSDTTFSLSMLPTYPRRSRREKRKWGARAPRLRARVWRLLTRECNGETGWTQGLSAGEGKGGGVPCFRGPVSPEDKGGSSRAAKACHPVAPERVEFAYT